MQGRTEDTLRKIKLQVQTTVDGYMAGPNGEMDWILHEWSDDVGACISSLMESVDTIILGRNLAEGFIPAWASRPEGEPEEAIDWMNDTPKVVISDSLTESPWPNATIVGTNVAQTIGDLKEGDGGDLIVYGGATTVRGLLEAGLIDELHLFVNPTAIGAGMAVFPTHARHRFRLVEARQFTCGMAVMHYAPARE
jgi:dihydrofolate reductase